MIPRRKFLSTGAAALIPAAQAPKIASDPLPSRFRSQRVTEDQAGHKLTLDSTWDPNRRPETPRTAVLFLGAMPNLSPSGWARRLLDQGICLAALQVEHPPEPNPQDRPVWLHFDARFAHFYAQIAERTPRDVQRAITLLKNSAEPNIDRFGMLGISTTGIAALAAACRVPDLASVLTFVATGAIQLWLETWKPNGLWKGPPGEEIREATLKLLQAHDPIRHTAGLKGKRVLMINGAEDRVVDLGPARAFAASARNHMDNSNNLRHVVYEGFGHNLPEDVVGMYAAAWFKPGADRLP
jgi:pimeloyl-ACP methyl ester carboxylesterase